MTISVTGPAISRSGAAGVTYPATTLRAGRIGLPAPASTFNTTPVVADTMYAYPILVPSNATITGVALQLGTAVAGVFGKLGLALPGPDGFPLTTLGEGTAAVDMNSLADAELIASFASSLARPPGVLWGLAVFNGAAQPVTIGAFSVHVSLVGHFIGPTTIGNYTGRGATGGSIRLSRAHTYANAFPATLTGWSVANSTPSSPVMVAVTA